MHATTEADSVAEALGDVRPEADQVDRAMVRGRVANALFAAPVQPVKVGRFHLLERVGRGGMGVVYAAYDPDLDRRVAVKLVPVDDRATRARWLAEAQAQARLAHPNVVPVHDVSVVDDRICIVMEFVAGETLRTWCGASRSPRAILDVYRQAGQGLDAAHRAGLVHRDFKPENAIVGVDGRVRVVDFGLAHAVGHVARDRAGTPRYMAPEQTSGDALTPAADQYAFCAALREALDARAPRWLVPALVRGTAREPEARFATMAELLRVLARDPAVIRRRRWIVAGTGGALAGAAAIAFFVGRGGAREHAVAPCSGGTAEIAGAWSASTRASVEARLAATGEYGAALVPRTLATLDGYASAWAGGHRAACEAHRRGEETDALLDRRMACLDRSRSALAALGEVLATVEVPAVPDAMVAVAALPDLARCDDTTALLAAVEPPPADIAAQVARLDGALEQAQLLLAAGRSDEARRRVTEILAAAPTTAYDPLEARALLVLGRTEIALEQRQTAIAPLHAATLLALGAGDHAVAVEAYARWAWVSGTTGDGDDALASAGFFAALGGSLRDGFPLALLHNNAGSVELARGERDRARESLERALAVARSIPAPAPVELTNVAVNLALVVDDGTRRDELFAGAIAELTRALGADHPRTLGIRVTAGRQTADDAAAEAALAPVCATLERLHPDTAGAKIAECWFEVGWLAHRRGARDEARAAFAAAAPVAERSLVTARAAVVRGYLALARDDAAAAEEVFAETLAALPRDGDDVPWFTRASIGEAHLGIALARRATGDARGAAAAFARAAEVLTAVIAAQPLPSFQRRLARARDQR
jgi:eukaryotic-like serine/threonine-protein kinase